MRAVNLLPEELRPGHRWANIGRRVEARRVLGGAGVAAGVLALALAVLVVHERGVVADRQSSLRAVQARLVAAEAKAAEVRAAQAASAARLAAARDVITRRVVWEDVLRDLARLRGDIPNVYLKSLQVTSSAQGAAAAGTTSGFTIAGSADSQNRVAQVLDRLALLPWLDGVTLQSSVRGGEGSTPVQFTIMATFSPTGGR